jgi:integrase
MPHSTKPRKPHKDFPLFPHATGRWAKKVRGKLQYFGKWDNPAAALAKWLDQKDDLLAGRTPRTGRDGLTVRDLVNRFLTAKMQQRDAGELSATAFADYHATCGEITGAFGLTRLVDDLAADDFEGLRAALGKRLGPVALGNRIQRIRTVFKYGYDAGLFDKPVRFGPQFKKPHRRTLRLAKQAKGPKMLSATDVYGLVGNADQPLKAMFLLAINCGFGNADCGTLPLDAIDLKGGWINFARRKTGVPRRCKLWRETIVALREAIAKRPKPKDDADAGVCFITKYGAAWYTGKPGGPVTNEAIKVFKALDLHSAGRGFYTLRHVFQTIGDEAKDPVATRAIMGHVDDSMSGAYREGVSDERLAAVAAHVRKWYLSGKPKKKATTKARAKSKAT